MLIQIEHKTVRLNFLFIVEFFFLAWKKYLHDGSEIERNPINHDALNESQKQNKLRKLQWKKKIIAHKFERCMNRSEIQGVCVFNDFHMITNCWWFFFARSIKHRKSIVMGYEFVVKHEWNLALINIFSR